MKHSSGPQCGSQSVLYSQLADTTDLGLLAQQILENLTESYLFVTLHCNHLVLKMYNFMLEYFQHQHKLFQLVIR